MSPCTTEQIVSEVEYLEGWALWTPLRRALLGFALLAAVASTVEAVEPEPEPRIIGRLFGAKNAAQVRTGLWIGFLSRGLFSFMQQSEVVGPPDSAVGRGSGIISEVGLKLTVGDYDFAVSALTDELLSPSDDAIDELVENRIARTVLRELIGELKSRALEELIGTEIGFQLRLGNFEGSVDGRQFGFRDNRVWVGSANDTWNTSFLSGQISAGLGETVDALFLRYTRFSKPQAIEIIGVDPPGLQTARVNAVGLGVTFEREITSEELIDFEYQVSAIPLTGIAVVDYGAWGSLVAPLFEAELSVTVVSVIDLAGWIAIKPYAGFRANLISPIGGAFGGSTLDENEMLFLLPDYLIWGPIFGIEVLL